MKKLKIGSFLVQANNAIDTKEDQTLLTSKLFNVNLRLMASSKYYKTIISTIIHSMKKTMLLSFADYDYVRGISGANIGVPLNIIVINTADEIAPNLLVMINPVLTYKSKKTRLASSNCGSLLLKTKIKVERHEEVTVRFYDTSGHERNISFTGGVASTIQHEIDHNKGILITNPTHKTPKKPLYF